MRLYNTLSRTVERFRPRPGQPVGVYVCGITPYDTTHLGHAFLYVTFDVLIRHLEKVHGWPVQYVQNVTDIDDDILRKAEMVGQDWRALGQAWTERFTADLTALNARPPDFFPGATAYIAAIQAQVTVLIRAGRAYERSGSVYYRVTSEPRFGALAGLGPDEMLATANERGNRPDDPDKEDPLDFVLWQAGQAGEPAWSSPWGPGRPGWHIECTSMATTLLGPQVDIHGGGGDLVFPHHACEIAQAEPITGVHPFVRFWLHVAMVRMAGEKMSKSLGNLVLVRDLLAQTEPDALRLYLLGHHYRTAWEWDPARLAATTAQMRTLHAAAARARGSGRVLDPSPFGPRFTAALDNDLDTPAAVEVALQLADAVLGAPAGTDIGAAQDVLRVLAGDVLGLWLRPWANVSPQDLAHWPVPEIGAPDITALPAHGAPLPAAQDS
jgi:L-cysteine:1D-myo-inositol 2-amino-2-deoxy-alpha-D-glucopyranoside ligase